MLAKRRRVERSASAYAIRWRDSRNVYVILAELTVVAGTTLTVTRWSASAHTHVNVEVGDCGSKNIDTAVRAAAAAMAEDITFGPTPVRHNTTTLTFMRGRTPFHRAAIGYLFELTCWR